MTKFGSVAVGSVLLAAAALGDGEGRALLRQRSPGKSTAGLWEFAGGKVETREPPEAAPARELQEEPGIMVALDAMPPCSFTSAPLDDRRLLILLYIVRDSRGGRGERARRRPARCGGRRRPGYTRSRCRPPMSR